MTFPFRIMYAFACSMLNVPDTHKATHIHRRIIIKCFSGSFTSVPVEVRYHDRHKVFGCARSSGGHWVCHCTGWLPYNCVHSFLATRPHSFCYQLVVQLWFAQAVCPFLRTYQIKDINTLCCHMAIVDLDGDECEQWIWCNQLRYTICVTLLVWASSWGQNILVQDVCLVMYIDKKTMLHILHLYCFLCCWKCEDIHANCVDTRWFKYDRDWIVCKQAALRSSCATLREWSHNLHPPSCWG